jgi:hypothetical protein
VIVFQPGHTFSSMNKLDHIKIGNGTRKFSTTLEPFFSHRAIKTIVYSLCQQETIDDKRTVQTHARKKVCLMLEIINK